MGSMTTTRHVLRWDQGRLALSCLALWAVGAPGCAEPVEALPPVPFEEADGRDAAPADTGEPVCRRFILRDQGLVHEEPVELGPGCSCPNAVAFDAPADLDVQTCHLVNGKLVIPPSFREVLKVRVRRDDGLGYEIATAPDGRFDVALAHGTYAVSVDGFALPNLVVPGNTHWQGEYPLVPFAVRTRVNGSAEVIGGPCETADTGGPHLKLGFFPKRDNASVRVRWGQEVADGLMHLLPGRYAVWIGANGYASRFVAACDGAAIPSGEFQLGDLEVSPDRAASTLEVALSVIRAAITDPKSWGPSQPPSPSAQALVRLFADADQSQPFWLPWTDGAVTVPSFSGCYGIVADGTAPYSTDWHPPWGDPESFVRKVCIDAHGVATLHNPTEGGALGIGAGQVSLRWLP